MARHNREGRGEDQHGRGYTVAYQPDWLRQVKVTCDLDNGRQSTKTLVRNPDPPLQDPGPRVRTRITCEALGLDLEVVLHDGDGVVHRIVVETAPRGAASGETVVFSLSRAVDDASADD